MVTRLPSLVGFALGLALAATARAEDKKDDATTKVTGTVIVPKDVASFDGRVLELRLYAIDKTSADKKADLVEKVEIKQFTHIEGKETKKEFTIGTKGELKESSRYYITAFVLKGEDRTHIGQADHVKVPLNKVLTEDNPREITIRFKEIGKKVEMTTPIGYINTDLDLVAAYELGPLVTALESCGIYALGAPQQGTDGSWYAVFELNTYSCDPNDSPERTISTMLDALESLGGDVQVLWSGCSLRQFDIGYDCGTEPGAFSNGLSNRTLQRMAQVGASLRITLYPLRPDPAP